jgi:hypothetical protein
MGTISLLLGKKPPPRCGVQRCFDLGIQQQNFVPHSSDTTDQNAGLFHVGVSVGNLRRDAADAFNPTQEIVHNDGQITTRAPSQGTQSFYGGHAVTVIASAVLPGDLQFGTEREPVQDGLGILEHGSGSAAAHVERLEIGGVFFEREHVGIDHILNMHKISGLVAILDRR